MKLLLNLEFLSLFFCLYSLLLCQLCQKSLPLKGGCWLSRRFSCFRVDMSGQNWGFAAGICFNSFTVFYSEFACIFIHIWLWSIDWNIHPYESLTTLLSIFLTPIKSSTASGTKQSHRFLVEVLVPFWLITENEQMNKTWFVCLDELWLQWQTAATTYWLLFSCAF